MADQYFNDFITSRTEDTDPSFTNDYAPVYDASAGVTKKVKLQNLLDQDAIDAALEVVPTFTMRFWRPEYEITAGDVDPGANTITLEDHRLSTGTQGAFDTTWGGFTSGTPYFVIVIDANTIKLASTRLNARNGAAMDISGDPGGTVTFTSTNGHHIYAGKLYRTKTQMTYSFGDSDVDVGNNTINLTNHIFDTGHGVQFASTWGGVSSGTLYFAIKVDANTIKVASSYLNAIAGTAVDINADPGGTVSLFGTYGHCYYDALVTPQLNAEYPFSAGYGGSHVILFGFNGGSGNRIGLTGNVSVAAGGSVEGGILLDSGSDEAFIGYPVHIAVAIREGVLVTLLNGVPCKRYTKATGRGADDDGTDTGMYIGGSDHSNYEGDIYWVRIFENHVPFFYSPGVGGCLHVSPRPLATYWEQVSDKYVTANLLLNFSQPATTIANLGRSIVPERTNHGHRAAGTDFDKFQDFNSFEENELPQQIRMELPERPDYGLTPTAVPVGAKIFDSFKRNDIVYLWQNHLGLGQTEGGSLGVKTWNQTDTSTPRHGILFGRAYVEGIGGDTTREYVINDTTAMKVEIKNCGNETEGMVLFCAYNFATDTGIKATHGALNTISIQRIDAGVPTSLGTVSAPASNNDYVLGLEYTSTEHVKVYIDGVEEDDFDNSAATALTGVHAGFTSSVGYCRFEDFAVYAASA